MFELKYSADRRTVVYMIITTALLVLQWNLSSIIYPVYILSLFMAISVAVIAHNHNHVPMWKSRPMNIFTDYWLTVFYGFPAFGWIPTHNRNHHNLNNKEGDFTITYRLSEKNNLLTLLSYPSMSSYFQQKPIRDYLKLLYKSNKTNFYFAAFQYVALALLYIGGLILDWKKTLLFIVIPHQVALFSILIFNYLQHVHADEESDMDHSRNFTGFLNVLLFNNGYHTIHHKRANLHWSLTPAEHHKIENMIDPALNEKSFWRFIVRTYFAAIFVPRLGTVSKRLQRIEAKKNQPSTNVLSVSEQRNTSVHSM